ncbi:hypothetical protein SSSV4_ORF45 [Sulfolobus spindle-shaped virus 4]|uniref:C2H2-type domain-containing protein n=2 Tax=Alphafusellovirus TaxID=10475 RepID=A8TKJ9_9VIRU|nr:hypothetical protein SSSV4_ORF45 [Sulfolobus spindle-shaped virus 4]YP_002221493.1 hypothetical protein SSSV5_gp28 [Sulfolobus spindle-shaped virus 5]ABV26215.1 hypothetical protein [Sulfolobus spindle-shaped virus 4]ABV26249.1 hypothetical protein [Sulfolobus spindle-shaped virus 5]
MLMYQCIRCGQIYRKKKEVMQHLIKDHRQGTFTLEYFYMYFRVRE